MTSMEDNTTASSTPAFSRKRVDLQSDLNLPVALVNQLKETSQLIAPLHERQQQRALQTSSATAQVKVIQKSLASMFETATTPEHFLRSVSNITSALRSLKAAAATSVDDKDLYDALAALLSDHFVLPFLMDCRARFAHRALFTLLRGNYDLPSSPAILHSVEGLFRKVFLQNDAFLADQNSAPRLFILEKETEERRGTLTAAEKQAEKTRVLHFLNSLDCLSSTVMTQVPDVFQGCFVGLLPLLADAMQWAVEEALVTGSQLSAHVHAPSAGDGARGAAAAATAVTAPTSVTIGEDLDNIRFTVRVVTSFVHKHLTALDDAWNSEAERSVLDNITRLALPMFVMLASSDFPKDVLNATGLLFASILTLRRRSAGDIHYFVKLICSDEDDDTAAAKLRLASMRDAGALASDVATFVRMTCGKEGEGPSSSSRSLSPLGGGHGPMTALFTKITLNGRFAVCKGLLSHLSSPAHHVAAHGDAPSCAVTSVGVLMASYARPNAQHGSALYEDIVPFAFHCSSSAEDSETRFMAIQTLDAVVRHVSAVLRFVLKTGKSAGAGGGSVGGTAGVPAFALPSKALFHTLQSVSQIVTDLWDDSTTQISGTLTDTFDEIVKVNELLRQCLEWAAKVEQGQVQPTTPHLPVEELSAFVMDGTSMLKHVLLMSPERRGRYHALLALLSAVPLPTFLTVLGEVAVEQDSARHAGASPEGGDNAEEAHVAAFACTLLSGASNHKIGNVCGDTFTRLARRILEAEENKERRRPHGAKDQRSTSTSAHTPTLLEKGLIEPLSRMLTQENRVQCAAASVTPATNLSNMVAHFVAPLVKCNVSLLQNIMGAVLSLLSTEKERAVYAMQTIVEILVRSRGAGVDVQPHLKDPRIFRLVQLALQAAQPEIRSMAVTLAVLGTKKFVPITGEECATVETYLSLNMHLGGDTTAQKQLTELFRKWTKRVVDSYAEARRAAPRGAGGVSSKALPPSSSSSSSAPPSPCLSAPLSTNQITEHATRLARVFSEHMGADAAAAGVEEKLSVERRVMASRLYLLFVRAWLQVVAADDDARKAVLIPSVVPVLFSDLSDGWSLARDAAKSLLRIFIEQCPEYAYAHDDHAACAADTVVADTMAAAERDALRAHAHRNAVGSASRVCLAVLFLSRARAETADTFAHHLMDRIDAHMTRVSTDCAHLIAAPTVLEKYTFIQENPLHGRLALCSELLAQLLEVHAEEAARTTAGPAVDIQSCLNGMFECCSQVLQACSTLVGSETSAEESVVDCRGHVYDKGASHSEADMRGVVNNTWLGIRVATGTMPLIMSHCGITTFAPDVVRRVCFSLVHALLTTKHNGVMRCAREALNVLTRNLMRCRAPELFRIPTELLAFLLGTEGVASTDASRMLRRSQGLPHAILAILEAEDPTTPFVLFPLAMKALLSIAVPPRERDDSEGAAPSNLCAAELSQRSNALNVLKFIFENKCFSDCLSPYVESAFSLATCGMGHPSWNIRNSSLMLFSSVLQRLVGEHPSTGGVGVNTSLVDIARRTPRVMQFIVAELRRHEEALVVAAASERAELEESLALFPVLQLLSMLSPDGSASVSLAGSAREPEGEMGAGVSAAVQETASVTENVWRCHASPHLMIRTSSAAALTCIVPTSGVVALLLRAAPVIATQRTGDKNYLNKVHGVLVQLAQFHRRYVGTAWRRRQREHMYTASAAAKQSIRAAITSVLVQSEEKLRWCCERCPTIAVAALTLFNDLLHCAHGAAPGAPAADHFPLLCVFGARVIRGVVCAPSAPPLVEKGDLMQCSALGVVLLLQLVKRSAQSEPSSRAVQSELRAVMQHVSQQEALVLRDGQHHFVSRLLECLCHTEENADSTTHAPRDGFALLVDAFCTHFDYDLPSVSLAAVRSTVVRLSHASRAPAGEEGEEEAELGCVSWYELSLHFQFLVRYFSKQEGSAGLQRQLRSEVASLLEDNFLRGARGNPTSASRGVGYLANSEVLRDALAFYAMHATSLHAGGEEGIDVAARVLSCYAQPEHVPLIRDAVVEGLQVIVRGSRSTQPQQKGVAPSLLFVLLRLLCDDAAQVREHACHVATDCINGHCGTNRGCLDQVSCILGLVLMLRRARTADERTASQVSKLLAFYFSDAEQLKRGDDGTAEEGGGEGGEGGDDNEEETEVLFEKEADNMFIEDGLLLFMRQEIAGDHTTTLTRGSVFPSYAKLIAKAEASGSFDFFSAPVLSK